MSHLWANFWLLQSIITNGFGCYLLYSKFLTAPWPLVLTVIWTILVRCFSKTKSSVFLDIASISLAHFLCPRVSLNYLIISLVSMTVTPFMCIQVLHFLNPDAVAGLSVSFPEIAALKPKMWHFFFLAFTYIFCMSDLFIERASEDRRIQAYFGLVMVLYSIQSLVGYLMILLLKRIRDAELARDLRGVRGFGVRRLHKNRRA